MSDITTMHKQSLFDYKHLTDVLPDNSQYYLHNEKDMYKIIFFISGNCEFRVEGTVYSMHPYDILVMHSGEMHMMCHKEPYAGYERIVLHIHNAFFTKNNCEEFKKIFTARPLGRNNLICADLVRQCGIDKIFEKIDEYITKDENVCEILMRSKLIELLYNMNRISVKSDKKKYYNESVTPVLVYINENLRKPMQLDTLAAHFYMNKYHLCHIFKEQTGLTVNKYITYKRILLVRKLYFSGMPLTHAALEAGFGSYSDFYRMYVKEMGKSPKEMKNEK